MGTKGVSHLILNKIAKTRNFTFWIILHPADIIFFYILSICYFYFHSVFIHF